MKPKLSNTVPVPESTDTVDRAPRRLTVAENAFLTLKVLALLAVVGVALWGINVWTAAK